MAQTLIAPTPAHIFTGLPSGRTYRADASGNITNVLPLDIAELIQGGCTYPGTGSGSPGIVATTIAASGSSLTMTFQGSQKFYDITQNMPCALNIDPTGATTGQAIIATVRGPYTWTGPSNVAYPNSTAPTPQCSATLFDKIQYILEADGSISGFPVGLGVGKSGLTINALSGTYYSTSTVPIAGTYTGTVPTNLDYSLDGGAFTTLAAGSVAPSNGNYSFNLPSIPAAGPHTIQVRATGTGTVSPTQSFTIAAAAAPGQPSLGASGNNGMVVLTSSNNNPNGATINDVQWFKATSAGAESATPLATTTATNGSATYTDNAVTNGTTYYYTAKSRNSVGSSVASNEVSATPSASAGSLAHYLAGDSTHNATAPGKAEGLPTGYVDLISYCAPATYGAQNLQGRWASGGNNQTNSEFIQQISNSGYLFVAAWSPSGSFLSATSSALISTVIAAGNPVYLRAQVNASSGTVSGVPANSVAFSTSTDGTTYTALGTTQPLANSTGGGLPQLGSGVTSYAVGTALGGSNTFTGKFFKASAARSDGVLIYNPDFTAQVTGATSFNDTAATPNTWTMPANTIA